ncbi:DNA polymerase III subunit alpha [Thermanaerosceptrum fracticalcis]|uniref:DNA polymerase III subunit alpha n=1 Tax=Thermanaerosceptrum fracticalcis TaxID=1712410 RepID=A0A7G6E6G6_THEFR|nr:DNA polymerase III subunit alpha [Thermanaerosceptrum fracticalcis]QNB47670.1 DNA polymerase III subunit alpha [Thermanaerosceptrum fracticalcis]
MSFVHLHNHTCYSLLDGASKIPELVQQAKEQGMQALAITDHGVMYGVIEFYKEAKKASLKPIIGCEVYVARRSRWDKVAGLDDSPYHLVLLAENQEGYQNLIKLVSAAWLEGFYYKPRVDKELLKKYHKGLIALSACLAGEVPALLLEGKEEEARVAALDYQDIFGRDNFFLELQDHGLAEQHQVNSGLLRIARDTRIPLVATNDVHYTRRNDAAIQDILLCIQTGKTLQDQDRMRFETEEFYLKSAEEMRLLFGDYPEALANTVRIAERCQVDFKFGENFLPFYEVPHGYNVDTYLEHLCQQGLRERYPKIEPKHQERLAYELSIIKKMGYSSYFLIVWDFIHYAKKQGIFVGPGRGSAAGSLVSYCLGITDIDPLKYDLLFERFLNPERVSMPDIDIDFCFERRGEIIEYVVEKYGADRVAQIITFGTMAARAAIRDAGRAMNVPLALVDKVAKLVPSELGITIDRALEVSPELVQLAEEDNVVKQLLMTARALEGMPRHAGTHAAGIVISQRPLDQHLPLQKTTEGLVSTQFDKDTVEEIGLLKMDLLGLRTLTVINNTVELIVQSQNKQLDINRVPLDDKKTYELLSEGDTIGVFQLESSGLRAILRELKPQTFEDIVALVALYRPGPLGSGMVEDFIKRRHGEVEVKYLHPALEPILRTTYGVILYQEQVMRIASDLAGFTLGEADLLRRAMGKKKPEIIAGLRKQFVEGAVKNGVDGEVAGKIFDLMEYFAGYGFNKSHSAAYAILAYQTAYLKAHYPVEFMAALLTSVMESSDRVPFYIEECRQHKIAVLPPDVNESAESFLVSGNKIRFGLAAIKQVGHNAIQAILEERKNGRFLSLQDFCERVDLSQVNRRVLENLIKCGAFGSVPGTRAQLLEILHLCIDQGLAWQRQKNSNQLSLFDLTSTPASFKPSIPLPEVRDFSEREILQMEKETLGLYLSGHPLAEFMGVIRGKTTHVIEELAQATDGDLVVLAGVITAVRRTVTKRGETMAYFTLEDLSGSVEALLFPKNLAKFNNLLKTDSPVLVKARLNLQEDKPKIFVESISSLTNLEWQVEPGTATTLYLKISPNVDENLIWEELRPIIALYQGKTPLYLYFPHLKKLIKSKPEFWVNVLPQLMVELESLTGVEAISVVNK